MTVARIVRYHHELPVDFDQLLLGVHVDARADRMHDPFAQRFHLVVDHWTRRPGFSCVVSYAGREPTGFAYGAPLAAGREWWRGLLDPAPAPAVTFGVSELMVRPAWRGQGLAGRLHDALLEDRPEELVCLLAEADQPRARARCESRGYRPVGPTRPVAGSPAYTVMLRRLRAAPLPPAPLPPVPPLRSGREYRERAVAHPDGSAAGEL
ncbi:GNAT family N-acetyltransferase [Kitasatospora purpeofusca]|uniref:GNAT family N-acetyltransferase n=1 Tax=Kitasatospora purpeofusca TaxID=67352 RepID=UPI0035D709A9